jgi:hypothetical protein
LLSVTDKKQSLYFQFVSGLKIYLRFFSLDELRLTIQVLQSVKTDFELLESEYHLEDYLAELNTALAFHFCIPV